MLLPTIDLASAAPAVRVAALARRPKGSKAFIFSAAVVLSTRRRSLSHHRAWSFRIDVRAPTIKIKTRAYRNRSELMATCLAKGIVSPSAWADARPSQELPRAYRARDCVDRDRKSHTMPSRRGTRNKH